MSTRAIYCFTSDNESHYVYVHHDGYPQGAYEKLRATVESGLAWSGWSGRFEADEFGAAFIAANKTGPGSVRLVHGPDVYADTAYLYELSASPNGQLILKAYEYGLDNERTEFYYGRLKDFLKTWAED